MPLHHHPLSTSVRTALITLALAGSLSAGSSQAQVAIDSPTVHEYQLDVGPLGRSLTNVAGRNGLPLSFDPALVEGLKAPALQGSYTASEAFEQLLAGSGLRLVSSTDGRYGLVRADNNSNLQLAPITVVGANQPRHSDPYLEPRSVNVIEREQIDRRPPRHAADMLVDVPGVSSAVNRLNPGLSVNIRGMQDFGRVNMMIDGMRQNHVESGHQQRNGEMYVDSELLSTVVIEKGPNAGVHGANATAGSANFQTLDFADVLLPGLDRGVRLRASSGIGSDANGAHFLGSAAVAQRFDNRLELLAARSRKSLGEYRIGNRGRPSQPAVWSLDGIEEVSYSDQQQDSWLAKARLHLTDEQNLLFTYVATDIGYNNTSSTFSRQGNSQTGYQNYGDAEARNRSYSLDYSYNPDNPLLDLKVKSYFVSTANQRITTPSTNMMADIYWNNQLCLGDSLEDAARNYCLAGMRKDSTSRTDTWGLQLENTSRFELTPSGAELAANYGIEWFQDEGKSSNKADRNGQTTPYLSEQIGNNLNPNGLRDVASAFASLTFRDERFTLKTGLRYDWYHLRGKTTVPGTSSQYLSRIQSFAKYFCDLNQTPDINRRGCELGRAGDEAAAAAWYNSLRANYDYATTERFQPKWIDEYHRYEFDVDERMGRFSPFISAAYRPFDWLELFANWGKGFRPPAMTETLWEGSHGAGSSSWMYPNPTLDAERTRSWELGFNILRQHLLQNDDSLAVKMAYFNTRADQYVITTISNTLPGQIPGLGLGNTFFQNNHTETRFKGLELQANYDAGSWYSGLNYTKYLGGNNDFCTKIFPVGSHSQRWDQPNEDGSMSTEHQQAIAEGYGSYQEKMDAMTYCGVDVLLNSAAYMPMDQHGGHAGIRLFNRTLDLGLRYNRTKGDDTHYSAGRSELWDSYTTWDFYARYQPIETLAVSLSIENLRDENYLSAYSDSMSRTYAPGRTVQAGLELRF